MKQFFFHFPNWLVSFPERNLTRLIGFKEHVYWCEENSYSDDSPEQRRGRVRNASTTVYKRGGKINFKIIKVLIITIYEHSKRQT